MLQISQPVFNMSGLVLRGLKAIKAYTQEAHGV
jgi:hypothetical protein